VGERSQVPRFGTSQRPDRPTGDSREAILRFGLGVGGQPVGLGRGGSDASRPQLQQQVLELG
jgi:hypothetical protein